MDVVSNGPLRVASILWQPKPSTWVLTVVCKATFLLTPGESRLAEEQEEPSQADVHFDDDESKSLKQASDLAPFKPRADIVVVGHAHAARKQPVTTLTTRLLIGEVDKSIDVFADRAFGPDGAVRQGAPFTRMPLRYERAAGGAGTSNPVGIAPWPDRQGMIPIPNLQPAGLHVTSPQKPVPTINYGPIAPAWPQRLEKVSFLGPAWSHRGWAQKPIPEGLDRGYFNVAPRDQQVEAIRPAERIILENLHPEHARLITTLPGLTPRAVVEHPAGLREDVELYCDTLVIDTDQGRCTLTWRGQLRLEHPNQPGRVTVSTGGAARLDVRSSGVDHTADLSAHVAKIGALPFAPTPAAPPVTPAVAPAWQVPAAPVPAPPPLVRPAYPTPMEPPPGHGLSIGQMAKAAPIPDARPSAPEMVGAAGGGEMALGALAASDAAAKAAKAAKAPVDEDEAPPDTARPAAAPPRELVSLLWFEPKAVARMRRKPGFRRAIDSLEMEAPDADLDAGDDSSDQLDERRDVLAILTRETPVDAAGIDAAVAAATRRDGSFIEPLILGAGELQFPFDELETLKATAAAVTPLVADDKNLRATLDLVNELLKTPWLHGSSGGAVHLTGRVKEAFAQGRRMLPAGYLDAQTERALLEQRHYQRRTVFGKTWLRALFRPAGGEDVIPTYLPESLAKELPMFQRFTARMVAEVHFQQDQYETHPQALRVVALARVIPARR